MLKSTVGVLVAHIIRLPAVEKSKYKQTQANTSNPRAHNPSKPPTPSHHHHPDHHNAQLFVCVSTTIAARPNHAFNT